MKLTYAQLEPHLAKNLSSAYIVSGEEITLKQDVITLIRKAAKNAGINERVRLIPEAGFDWEQLYNLLYANSLLAEKRIIELDFRDTTPNKIAANILHEYGKNPVTDNLLLIDIGKLDDKIAKSAWYQALDKIGITVAIWPIPREQLPQWIMNRAKKYKLQFNHDAAQLLAEYVEGNLVAASAAIEKLYLMKPQGHIDIALIQAILADESRFTIFDFMENVIAGNITRTLHILETLKEDGTEPTLILWGMTRELRLMNQLAKDLKQGTSYDHLFQKHRIFSRRQAAVRKFLSKFTSADCLQLLAHSAEIDRVIKGAKAGNIWNELQLFCLRFNRTR